MALPLYPLRSTCELYRRGSVIANCSPAICVQMINHARRFVNEFRNCEFRHCDRLISGIEAGTITLHSVNENGTDPNSNYLATYRVRLNRIDRSIETERTLANMSLRDDCEALCNGLLRNLEDLSLIHI